MTDPLEHSEPVAAEHDGNETWRRLSPRTAVALGVLVVLPAVPTLLIMAFSRASAGTLATTAGLWALGTLGLTGLAWVDWYFTWYRVTERRFELRKGAVFRTDRWIPRDRIRSADLTADPVRRLFGLTLITIGTGESGSTDLKLDSLSTSRAELLRGELLGTASKSTVDDAGGAETLARLRVPWLLYGGLTASLIAVVWGALGSAFGSARDLLQANGVLASTWDWFGGVSPWVSIPLAALGALLSGVLGALLLSIEAWWSFRLTREYTSAQDSALRVRRGLLTTRSVSLEERRLRGAEISEPLLLRWAGGARTKAVATGLNESSQTTTETGALLPPAPRAEAIRVATAALRAPFPDSAELIPHPRVALRRRFVRALAIVLGCVLVPASMAGIGWVPAWLPWLVGVVGLALGGSFAIDAYRNLGHTLTERYLLARRGTAIRRTVALRRSGIIGWRLRQSLFQRRVNLISVAATTAAGSGAYEIPDVRTEDGIAFAEQAVPGLLRPFLEYR